VGLGGTPPPPAEPALPAAPAVPPVAMGGMPPPPANGGAPPCCNEVPAAPPAARLPPAPPIGGDAKGGAPALPPVAVAWPPAGGEVPSNCTEGDSSTHPTSTASGSAANNLHRMGRSITLSDRSAHHLAHAIALTSFHHRNHLARHPQCRIGVVAKDDELDRYVRCMRDARAGPVDGAIRPSRRSLCSTICTRFSARVIQLS
jgi:hypothetical protein